MTTWAWQSFALGFVVTNQPGKWLQQCNRSNNDYRWSLALKMFDQPAHFFWELCCHGDVIYDVDVIDHPSIQQVLSVPDQTWPESSYYLSFVQLMVKHNKIFYVSFSGCLAATLYLTAMSFLQKVTTNVDCSGCYLTRVATVSRASFTLWKCEVTVNYCDKIQQIKSFSRLLCWHWDSSANLVSNLPVCDWWKKKNLLRLQFVCKTYADILKFKSD